MQTVQITTAWGIDVAKATLDLCIQEGENAPFFHQTIPNTPSGWQTLVSLAAQMPGKLVVVLEATGDYHVGCACTLTQAGITVLVTNPFVVHSYSQMNMRKTKTDTCDSEHMARLVYANHKIPPFVIPTDQEVKKLVRLRQAYRETHQKYANILSSLEDADRSGSGPLLQAVESIQKSLKHTEAAIAEIDEKIRTSSIATQAQKALGSIRGVSDTSIAQIVVELGDVQRFHHSKQVVAFCGLDPTTYTSGASVRGKSRLSKRGSPILRGLLTKAAWGLMMHDADTQAYYQKKRTEGKHYFTCLVAIARRFLIRLWTALKKGEKYLTPPVIHNHQRLAVS